jgi:IS30 family transposase
LEWKERANELYFTENKKINEIAETLGKTRKTISTFLSIQEGFQEEKERRKAENKEKRAEYKKDWEKKNRQNSSIDGFVLKRQHEIDVRVLSSEKY